MAGDGSEFEAGLQGLGSPHRLIALAPRGPAEVSFAEQNDVLLADGRQRMWPYLLRLRQSPVEALLTSRARQLEAQQDAERLQRGIARLLAPVANVGVRARPLELPSHSARAQLPSLELPPRPRSSSLVGRAPTHSSAFAGSVLARARPRTTASDGERRRLGRVDALRSTQALSSSRGVVAAGLVEYGVRDGIERAEQRTAAAEEDGLDVSREPRHFF